MSIFTKFLPPPRTIPSDLSQNSHKSLRTQSLHFQTFAAPACMMITSLYWIWKIRIVDFHLAHTNCESNNIRTNIILFFILFSLASFYLWNSIEIDFSVYNFTCTINSLLNIYTMVHLRMFLILSVCLFFFNSLHLNFEFHNFWSNFTFVL